MTLLALTPSPTCTQAYDSTWPWYEVLFTFGVIVALALVGTVVICLAVASEGGPR